MSARPVFVTNLLIDNDCFYLGEVDFMAVIDYYEFATPDCSAAAISLLLIQKS